MPGIRTLCLPGIAPPDLPGSASIPTKEWGQDNDKQSCESGREEIERIRAWVYCTASSSKSKFSLPGMLTRHHRVKHGFFVALTIRRRSCCSLTPFRYAISPCEGHMLW